MNRQFSTDGHGLKAYLALLSAALLLIAVGSFRGFAQSNPWTTKEIVDPSTLARQLKKSGPRPLLLQVGFRSLYDQGHIPGSRYCGPAFRADGITRLKECVKGVSLARAIVIYCGCCPWEECPNVRPAFETLKRMGFKNIRVLYIAHNFGRDWAQKGYPTER